jgi:6-phosphogluconolactonase
MIFNRFESRTALEEVLADRILSTLNEIVQVKKQALVLFSGGSTPVGLLKKLAAERFDWSLVTVSLVDDRMVEEDSSFSNYKMIKELFFDKIAPEFQPKLLPLVVDSVDFDRNMEQVSGNFENIPGPDLVILGMGNDGHFASLFPNDDASEEALKKENKEILVYTHAPAYPEDRISFSWSFLSKSRHLFLHITGDEKLQLTQHKETHKNLPVRVLLTERGDLEIFWAP